MGRVSENGPGLFFSARHVLRPLDALSSLEFFAPYKTFDEAPGGSYFSTLYSPRFYIPPQLYETESEYIRFLIPPESDFESGLVSHRETSWKENPSKEVEILIDRFEEIISAENIGFNSLIGTASPGEKVYVVGYPSESSFLAKYPNEKFTDGAYYSTGTVLSRKASTARRQEVGDSEITEGKPNEFLELLKEQKFNKKTQLVIEGVALPGMSGSAVVNVHGQIIGIVVQAGESHLDGKPLIVATRLDWAYSEMLEAYKFISRIYSEQFGRITNHTLSIDLQKSTKSKKIPKCFNLFKNIMKVR